MNLSDAKMSSSSNENLQFAKISCGITVFLKGMLCNLQPLNLGIEAMLT